MFPSLSLFSAPVNRSTIYTGTAIFLFAHQDDEYGAYQLIMDELDAGNDVYCIFFTDGSYGGADSNIRNSESSKILSKLGVKQNKILFYGTTSSIPDTMLVKNLNQVANWLFGFLKNVYNIKALYTPAWEGGHPDHDSLHAITVWVARKLDCINIVRQFPLYNAVGMKKYFFHVLTPLHQNGTVHIRKIHLLNRIRFIRYSWWYRSQVKTCKTLFLFVNLHYLIGKGISTQYVSESRIMTKPHPGKLFYERKGFCMWKWKSFNKCVQDFFLT